MPNLKIFQVDRGDDSELIELIIKEMFAMLFHQEEAPLEEVATNLIIFAHVKFFLRIKFIYSFSFTVLSFNKIFH